MTIEAHTGPVVEFTNACLNSIRRHGAAAFPHECCGALIAKHGGIVEALPLENTTDEAATHRFRVGPDDYRRAEAYARAIGGQLAGFYHSHPNAPARPSPYDLEHAWPNLIYAIVSVTADGPEEMAVWKLRDDRSRFDRGELQCHTGS
jgi:proteasome lid subunit RPN8/RPN11